MRTVAQPATCRTDAAARSRPRPFTTSRSSNCPIALRSSRAPARWPEPSRRRQAVLQLYFYPMACSLACRIALMEAGIEARYHLTDIWKKTVADDGGDFFAVSAKGAVPVLVMENGE